MTNEIILWIVFAVIIPVALVFDLLLHRNDRKIRMKEALFWSAIWISLALIFADLAFPDAWLREGFEFYYRVSGGRIT